MSMSSGSPYQAPTVAGRGLKRLNRGPGVPKPPGLAGTEPQVFSPETHPPNRWSPMTQSADKNELD